MCSFVGLSTALINFFNTFTCFIFSQKQLLLFQMYNSYIEVVHLLFACFVFQKKKIDFRDCNGHATNTNFVNFFVNVYAHMILSNLSVFRGNWTVTVGLRRMWLFSRKSSGVSSLEKVSGIKRRPCTYLPKQTKINMHSFYTVYVGLTYIHVPSIRCASILT